MDVLEYWKPEIDWARFTQGPLSARVWQCFQQVVQLAHAFRYWEDAARQVRRETSGRSFFGESASAKRKRNDEWRGRIRVCETHQMRAAYLAAEKMAELSYLIAESTATPADQLLYVALRVSIGYHPRYERGLWRVAAVDGFDAADELTGEAEEITTRWIQRATQPARP